MINLTQDQVGILFNLAGMKAPAEISTNDITKIFIELEKKISTSSYSKSKLDIQQSANVLVVDDLELSIHQLTLLLTKSGYNVYVARTKDEAIHQFNKNRFEYVMVDLFMPDCKDGLELVKTISSSEKAIKDSTKVLVISGTDDNELVNQCFVHGASEFIEKSPEWHKNIIKFIRQSEIFKTNSQANIVTEIIDPEKKIISITISNINKPNILNEIEKELLAQANSGYINIILDMKNIKAIESHHTIIFIIGYKACLENKGEFTVCNLSDEVKDTLSYVFLDNIINISKDLESAIDFCRK